ncbi:MAG: LysR substrate-binding domain-containing protein [Alphaproteobacteria bacterium]|nr:LysR substrate-binding domain-containing protein [Alphaproteobacteria bacterium]
MNWSDLPPLSMVRAYEAAARTGGFSAAGRELNVTHAAVAQQVRALEERLGVALMVRDGRGLKLTPEGETLAHKFSEAMVAICAAVREVEERSRDKPVSVTTTPTFASGWLMPRLRAFRQAHPGTELVIHPSIDVVDLDNGEMDLAIRCGEGNWPGMTVHPLVLTETVLVAAPALLQGKCVSEACDLFDLPWIETEGAPYWPEWLAARGITVLDKADITTLPPGMIREAVVEGHGVAIIARAPFQDLIDQGKLMQVMPDRCSPDFGFYIVHPQRPLRPPVAAFVAWLKAQAKEAE